MTASQWFRTQREPSQQSRAIACTIASTLSCMGAWSNGAVGPRITLDDFRRFQKDNVGGIDLYDAKYAASRFGVDLTVHADYGPGSEYTIAERVALSGERGATSEEAFRLALEGRFLVVAHMYGSLPDTWRRDPKFFGAHAAPILGARVQDGVREVLWGDPLDYMARWMRWAPIALAAGALAGTGKVWCAATPVPPKRFRARLRPLLRWWRYYRINGAWTRQSRFSPLGWEADCSKAQTVVVMGKARRMVRVTSGGYSVIETWLDLDSHGVTYKEIA